MTGVTVTGGDVIAARIAAHQAGIRDAAQRAAERIAAYLHSYAAQNHQWETFSGNLEGETRGVVDQAAGAYVQATLMVGSGAAYGYWLEHGTSFFTKDYSWLRPAVLNNIATLTAIVKEEFAR